MNYPHPRAPRLGLMVLAVLLIACSAGLGYVVHVTQQTAQHLGSTPPSLLPLIVLAAVAAVAGLGSLRTAVGQDDDVIG
jgi:hypothetical protein